MKAKQSFEKFAKSHGVNIKHYHADNGRFKDKAFMKEIEDQGQSISFIGVGALHQNGSAEKRIGDLQRRATTLLLHAQRRWPDAINTHLWLYAIRQLMTQGITHQPQGMMTVPYQDSAAQQRPLRFNTNTTLDVLYMFWENKCKMGRKLKSGRIGQG